MMGWGTNTCLSPGIPFTAATDRTTRSNLSVCMATTGTPYVASIVIACAATAGAQVLQWPTPRIAACPLALISSHVVGSSCKYTLELGLITVRTPGNAVERAHGGVATGERSGSTARLEERAFAIHGDEGVHHGTDPVESLENRLHHLERRDPAGAVQAGELDGRREAEIAGHERLGLCRRAVAGDGGAVHDTRVPLGVPGAAAVDEAAVVPDHEIVRAPGVAIDAIGARGQVEQVLQQRAAFLDGHALDVRGVRADVDGLLAVDGIGADEGLANRRQGLLDFGAEERRVDEAARVGEGMDGDLALEPALHLGGQRVPGYPAGDELRLAALGRHQAAGEKRCLGRHPLEGRVGVPHLVAALVDHAPVRPVHALAVLVHIGQLDQVGMQAVFLAQGLDGGLEWAEAQAEAHLLVVGQRLVAEEQEGMLVEGLPDVRPRAVVEWLAEIHARELDAEAGVEPVHLERAGRGRHRILLGRNPTPIRPAEISLTL